MTTLIKSRSDNIGADRFDLTLTNMVFSSLSLPRHYGSWREAGQGSAGPRPSRALYTLLVLMLTVATPATADKAYDYPFIDAFEATVIGTPSIYRATLPKRVPKEEAKIKVFPKREPPEVFWYQQDLRYSVVRQRSKAPLIFNIAGTGAGHNSAKMQVMERAFYQAGFHVVSLPSPTHPNFIATASETQVPGMLADDARDLYRVMQAVYREIAGSIEVSTFYLTGYSLGAAQAAFVAKLDEEVGAFDFEKVLMINPPVSLYNSVKRLDDMIGAIPGGAGNFPAFFESVFERFADVYRQEDFVDFANDFLYKIHKDQPLDTQALRALVGVSFRIASANIVFTSDVLTRSNVIVRRNRRLSSTDSLTNYYKASVRVSFTEYIDYLLLPFYRHRRPGITLDTLIQESSLEAIAPYLRSSNKIGLIHNADDIILDDSELNFLRTLLGDRARIYLKGGHCGNLEHRDTIGRMVDFFTDGWVGS